MHPLDSQHRTIRERIDIIVDYIEIAVEMTYQALAFLALALTPQTATQHDSPVAAGGNDG